jgi:hypothetical protein
MPLRHDGSGGTRSARPPASTPAQRTSHPTTLNAHLFDRRDFSGVTLSAEALNLGFVSTPAAEGRAAEIKVIEEVAGVTPFVALTRA